MNYPRVIYYRHNKCMAARRIPKHKVDFYELTVMLDGAVEYRINEERQFLGKGDLIYLRPGCFRERFSDGQPADYVSFNFLSDTEYEFETVIKSGVTPDIRYIIAACDEIIRMPGEGVKNIECLLGALLTRLSERAAHIYSPLTEQILNYIGDRMKERLTLEKIADDVHFSTVYCDTLFKKEVGRPIIDYLINERMNEAKSLLVETDISILEIARAVGYDDASYFSRLFKKRVGESPLRYRKGVFGKYIK